MLSRKLFGNADGWIELVLPALSALPRYTSRQQARNLIPVFSTVQSHMLDNDLVLFFRPPPLHRDILPIILEPVIVTYELRSAHNFAVEFPGHIWVKFHAFGKALTFLSRQQRLFLLMSRSLGLWWELRSLDL